MAQVALSWLIKDKSVVAIPGAKNITQLEANVQASELNLTNSEIDQLSKQASNFKPKMFF